MQATTNTTNTPNTPNILKALDALVADLCFFVKPGASSLDNLNARAAILAFAETVCKAAGIPNTHPELLHDSLHNAYKRATAAAKGLASGINDKVNTERLVDLIQIYAESAKALDEEVARIANA